MSVMGALRPFSAPSRIAVRKSVPGAFSDRVSRFHTTKIATVISPELAVFRPIPGLIVGTDDAFRLTAGSFPGAVQSFQGTYGERRPTD